MRDKLEDLARIVERQGRIQSAPLSSRPSDDLATVASLLTRIDSIEAALAKLADRKEPPAEPARPSPVQPKAKDQALVVQVAAKGTQEPGANTREYWCRSPREVYETFGKPDATKWSSESGQLDWFYWGPDGMGALQLRFEGGVVIGVWP